MLALQRALLVPFVLLAAVDLSEPQSAPAAPSAMVTGDHATLTWAAIAGAKGYDVQEWNWNGLVNGWYSSREDGAGTSSFTMNFADIELPACGRLSPVAGTLLRIRSRPGLVMEWRIRGLMSGSMGSGFANPGEWSFPSNKLTMPYNDGSNASAPPQACCFPGWFTSPGGTGECLPCDAGTWAGGGSMNCTDCPPHASSSPKSEEIQDCTCVAGYYDFDGSTTNPSLNCTAVSQQLIDRCLPYSSSPAGLTDLLYAQCSPGKYSPPGGLGCDDCLAGQADLDASAATPCTPCALGRFNTAPRLLMCADCASGRYAAPVGRTSCGPCYAGQDSTAGAATCCWPGEYADPGTSVDGSVSIRLLQR